MHRIDQRCWVGFHDELVCGAGTAGRQGQEWKYKAHVPSEYGKKGVGVNWFEANLWFLYLALRPILQPL